jgi:hypothetical protein
MFERVCSTAGARPAEARTAAVLAGVVAATMLAGCASESTIVENLLVVPGYYDTLPCPEIVAQIQASSARVKELTQLIERSSGNGAGPVVNALAYDTDYAKARATQKFSEEAARRKNCDLTKKVEQKPADQMPPPPAKSVFGSPAR